MRGVLERQRSGRRAQSLGSVTLGLQESARIKAGLYRGWGTAEYKVNGQGKRDTQKGFRRTVSRAGWVCFCELYIATGDLRVPQTEVPTSCSLAPRRT